MSLKLVDAVRCFKGGVSEDLEQWLDRFKVALDVTGKWSTDKERDEEMARLMPLFLEDRAYSTWKQLTDAQKKDLAEVKAALRRVYGLSKAAAWKKIKGIRLLPGDLIDVLADEITGLLKIVLGVDPPETLISIMLIDALPRSLAEQVSLLHGEDMKLRDIISCAKSLQVGQEGVDGLTAVATAQSNRVQRIHAQPRQSVVRCFVCRRYGHLQRDCPVTCFRCGQRGHFQRECKAAVQGNDEAGSTSLDHVAPAN